MHACVDSKLGFKLIRVNFKMASQCTCKLDDLFLGKLKRLDNDDSSISGGIHARCSQSLTKFKFSCLPLKMY